MRNYKPVFFVVLIISLLLAYVALFGLHFAIGSFEVNIPGAPDMRFGIDIRGGVDAVFTPKNLDRAPTDEELDAAKNVIETRLNQKNILDREVAIDRINGNIMVRFPWASGETEFNPQQAMAELGETAKLTFRDSENNVLLDGSHVVSSAAEMDTSRGGYKVILKFDDEGAGKFAKITSDLLNKPLSIYMDEQLIKAPTVSSVITNGSAEITGLASLEEAIDLKDKIASGALPFSMETKNHSVISPSLGIGALDSMVQAGALSFIIVIVALLVYYRLPGFVACIALILQMACQLLAVSLPQITLTLPGIAGIILSTVMSLDANIIIGERINEEISAGKTIDMAVSAGFDRGFAAVFDGNITVAIVSVILMIFGSGVMLSFAYSLFFGVIFNFLSGVLASRLMLWSLSRYKFLRKPGLFMNIRNVWKRKEEEVKA